MRSVLLGLLFCLSGYALADEPAQPAKSHSELMTELHNGHRARAGLGAQEVDANLTAVAQRWAEHMASRNSMFHGGGEQIIAYSGGDVSYEQGFRLWLNSSPHRTWLFSGNRCCGFGYARSSNGTAYYAGAFGSGGESVSTESYSSSSGSNGRRRLFGRLRRR